MKRILLKHLNELKGFYAQAKRQVVRDRNQKNIAEYERREKEIDDLIEYYNKNG